jgi:hypothetical protein
VGTLNTGVIQSKNGLTKIDLTNDTFSVKSASTGARFEMKNNVIKVYDANGVLRVKLGDLSA